MHWCIVWCHRGKKRRIKFKNIINYTVIGLWTIIWCSSISSQPNNEQEWSTNKKKKKTKNEISISLKCELIMTNDHLDSFESDKYVCNALNVMAMFCIDVDYYPKWRKRSKKKLMKNEMKWIEKKECMQCNFNQECNVEYGVWSVEHGCYEKNLIQRRLNSSIWYMDGKLTR